MVALEPQSTVEYRQQGGASTRNLASSATGRGSCLEQVLGQSARARAWSKPSAATAARSSASSATDASIRVLENSFTSRPSTTCHAPSTARTGSEVTTPFGDAVDARGAHRHRGPVVGIGTVDPIPDVIDRGVGRRRRRRGAARLDDRGAALGHGGDVVGGQPLDVGGVLGARATTDDGVEEIGVHGGRVVAPHRDSRDVGDVNPGVGGQRGDRPVVVEPGERGEPRGGDVGSVGRTRRVRWCWPGCRPPRS